MCFSDKHRAFLDSGFFELKIKEGKEERETERERASRDDHLPVGRKPDVACSPPAVSTRLPGSTHWGLPSGAQPLPRLTSALHWWERLFDFLPPLRGHQHRTSRESSAFYWAIPLPSRRACTCGGTAGPAAMRTPATPCRGEGGAEVAGVTECCVS